MAFKLNNSPFKMLEGDDPKKSDVKKTEKDIFVKTNLREPKNKSGNRFIKNLKHDIVHSGFVVSRPKVNDLVHKLLYGGGSKASNKKGNTEREPMTKAKVAGGGTGGNTSWSTSNCKEGQCSAYGG